MNEALAVIPARGGSTGIPRKNLVDLGGRPLIAWTIAAASASAATTRVVVSTDSPDIADAARAAGAEVPFLRSRELAGGDVHAVHAVLDALERLERLEGYTPGIVLMLLPTAPLRRAAHVDAAIAMVRADPEAPVVGVFRWNHYLTNLRYRRDGRLTPVVAAGDHNVQRQDQEPLYVVNGAMFAATPAVLRRHGSFHAPGAQAYVMPAEASIDINDDDDLAAARAAVAGLVTA